MNIGTEASSLCLDVVNSEMDGPVLNSHRGSETTFNAAECFVIAVKSILIVQPNNTTHRFGSGGFVSQISCNTVLTMQGGGVDTCVFTGSRGAMACF